MSYGQGPPKTMTPASQISIMRDIKESRVLRECKFVINQHFEPDTIVYLATA